MDSLQRIAKLGQIKGMAYEPTPSDVIMGNVAPNCHDPNACRDFDMDYFNSDFAELWSPSGRNDLGNIRSQNVNLMRLYNWTGNENGGTPLRDHRPYLDYCQKLGLGTMVPFSNYNARISGANALNTATSIVGELTSAGKMHPAAKMWQVTNEFELTDDIKPEAVARLVQYLVQAEESAGVTADDNKIPIVVGVSTAVKYGVPGQSMGQIEALRMAFQTGGTLPDGTAVQGNGFLSQRNVFVDRFVIGVQSFQFGDEIANFTQNVVNKYQNGVPILLTEHGFNSVEATANIYGGNGQSHDDANQARLVARQIDNINQLCKKQPIMRGMCFFQWLNTSYKCGVMGAGDKAVYSNTCTESNFGEVQWNDFGAGQAQPSKFGTTTKNQSYPIDTAIKKSAVHDAVGKGFAAS
jgi:hypothetical protein